MRVVIRFGKGAKIRSHAPHQNPGLALAVSALLTPAAVATAILGLWRIAADLDWASDFAIDSGFFSHWQVWIAAAILLELCARLLGRHGRVPTEEEQPPAAPPPAPVPSAPLPPSRRPQRIR
jgi:hypothetical protein